MSFFVSKHKTSRDSASDFQDVVSQGLKNLGNLSPSRAQLAAKASDGGGISGLAHATFSFWKGRYARCHRIMVE